MFRAKTAERDFLAFSHAVVYRFFFCLGLLVGVFGHTNRLLVHNDFYLCLYAARTRLKS